MSALIKASKKHNITILRCFATTSKPKPKPFTEIPGPKGLPIIGNLLGAARNGALDKQLHKHMEANHRIYGSIVKEQLGPGYTYVSITDPEDIEYLLRHEGRYPKRTRLDPWIHYRRMRGRKLGLLLE